MKAFLFAYAFAQLALAADPISYNTNGSTLSCNGVAGCVQNSPLSVSASGVTITYNPGSGVVTTPSIINYGNLTTSGSGTGVALAGVMLTINISSTPPGQSGNVGGSFTGMISTNNSQAVLTFGGTNLTTQFGTLPGVAIGTRPQFTFQLLNPSLGIIPPSTGAAGQTTIQGAVTDTTPLPAPPTTPIPSSLYLALLGTAAAGLYQAHRRRT